MIGMIIMESILALKYLLNSYGLLKELEECRDEYEAINFLKRKNLWGKIVDYSKLEALRESYQNDEKQINGVLNLKQLNTVIGGKNPNIAHNKIIHTIGKERALDLNKKLSEGKISAFDIFGAELNKELNGEHLDEEDIDLFKQALNKYLDELKKIEEESQVVENPPASTATFPTKDQTTSYLVIGTGRESLTAEPKQQEDTDNQNALSKPLVLENPPKVIHESPQQQIIPQEYHSIDNANPELKSSEKLFLRDEDWNDDVELLIFQHRMTNFTRGNVNETKQATYMHCISALEERKITDEIAVNAITRAAINAQTPEEWSRLETGIDNYLSSVSTTEDIKNKIVTIKETVNSFNEQEKFITNAYAGSTTWCNFKSIGESELKAETIEDLIKENIISSFPKSVNSLDLNTCNATAEVIDMSFKLYRDKPQIFVQCIKGALNYIQSYSASQERVYSNNQNQTIFTSTTE